MDSAHKAASLRERQTPRVKKRNKRGGKKHSRASIKHKTKKQSRARSKPPRHKAKHSSRRTRTQEPRTDPHTHRRRSFRDSLDASAVTSEYFSETDSFADGDLTDMPALDGNSSDEQKQRTDDEVEAVAVADAASVIETPAHERSVATPGDHAFIKGSDESDTPVSGGHDSDEEEEWPS